MTTSGLVIKRWVRTIPIKELEQQQAVIMTRYANELRLDAQRHASARVPGSSATGIKTGRLLRAIKVDGPFELNNTTRIGIYVDQSLTIAERDDSGFSYAKAQEHGTGWWGKSGQPIRAVKGDMMVWPQKNYPYRGSFVRAKLVKFTRERTKRGSSRRAGREYVQFASQVLGVQPKHYMELARKNKSIRSRYTGELAALYRNGLIAAVRGYRPLWGR